jgi:hypothetical protein
MCGLKCHRSLALLASWLHKILFLSIREAKHYYIQK